MMNSYVKEMPMVFISSFLGIPRELLIRAAKIVAVNKHQNEAMHAVLLFWVTDSRLNIPCLLLLVAKVKLQFLFNLLGLIQEY